MKKGKLNGRMINVHHETKDHDSFKYVHLRSKRERIKEGRKERKRGERRKEAISSKHRCDCVKCDSNSVERSEAQARLSGAMSQVSRRPQPSSGGCAEAGLALECSGEMKHSGLLRSYCNLRWLLWCLDIPYNAMKSCL